MWYSSHTLQERKRTLRSSPARSKRSLAATALSSDDEATTSTKSPRKKQVAKKSPGRPARQQQKQPILESPLAAGLYGREYQLRSKDSKSLILSSDDESSPAVQPKSKKTTGANTRMSLRESNFRRQLSDSNKASNSGKVATSTPQPKTSTSKSPQVKTKMRFESIPKKGKGGRPLLSIQEVAVDEDSSKEKTGKNLSVIEEAPEEEKKEDTPVVPDSNEEYPAWPPVGWKEFALAAFVTGLAAVGYVCYTTDYCSFC